MRFSFKEQCFRQHIPSHTSPAYLWFSFKEQCWRQHIPSHTSPACGSPSKNNALDNTFHHTHHQSTSGSPSKMGALSSPSLLRRVMKTGLFVPKPSSVGDMPWAWLPGDTCATQTTNIPSAGERKETEGTLLPEKWGQHFFLLGAAASLNKEVQEVVGWGGERGALDLAHYWCRFKSLVQQGIYFFKPTFSAGSLMAFWYFSSLFL